MVGMRCISAPQRTDSWAQRCFVVLRRCGSGNAECGSLNETLESQSFSSEVLSMYLYRPNSKWPALEEYGL